MARLKIGRGDTAALVALALAWLGIWGAWIPARSVALTQNAFDLAQWAEFLPDVRFGDLHALPDRLRLAVCLAALALALGAGMIRRWPWRWLVRGVALLPGLVLLPPYPYVLDLWRSDTYGTRFLIAALLWVGVLATLLLDRLPEVIRRVGVIGLCGAGAAFGWLTLNMLRSPFVTLYSNPLPPGWGVAAFCIGLIGAALLEIGLIARGMVRRGSGNTNGPAI